MTAPPHSSPSIWPRLAPLLAARAALGAALVLWLAPVCVDDYFRVFHAAWWWAHPSFTSSYEWPPGYLYVYGPAIGLTGDMAIAPRILTALLQLAAAAIVAAAPWPSRGARLLAAGLLLFSPLSLVVGTAPLSEALFVLLLLGGALALRRFLADGDLRVGLGAGALYLAATAVRYEGFVFAAAFTALVAARRPANTARWIGIAVAGVPWIFPIAWTALLWAAKGVPLSYLGNVSADHFGPGDAVAALATAEGAVTAALVLAALAVAAARVARAARAGGLRLRVLELHALVASIAPIAAAATGNVPSQYPLRLLYPALALGALPLAEALAVALAGRRRAGALAAIGAALALAGAAAAVAGRAPGVPAEDLAAAAAIRGAYASGALGPGDHAVVQHDLPSAAGVFVFAGEPERVHVDSLGSGCNPRHLTWIITLCPDPPWTGAARLAVVRAGSAEERYVRGLGWVRAEAAGSWILYLRPAGGPDLTRGRHL